MLKHGLNLFPLLSVNANWKDYWMGAGGSVYSTKKFVVPRLLKGQSASRFNSKYYTLNGRTYSSEYLMALAKQHPNFPKDTSSLPSAMVKGTSTEVQARTHAKNLAQGIAGRGYVIAKVITVDGEDVLAFGSKPSIHLSEASYADELKRLALSAPGVKFVGVKILGSAVAGALVFG